MFKKKNIRKDNMIVFGGKGSGQARSFIIPPSKEELKKLKEKAENAINIDDFEYLGEYIEKEPIKHFVKVYKDKDGRMYKRSEYLNEEEYLRRLKKYHFDEYFDEYVNFMELNDSSNT